MVAAGCSVDGHGGPDFGRGDAADVSGDGGDGAHDGADDGADDDAGSEGDAADAPDGDAADAPDGDDGDTTGDDGMDADGDTGGGSDDGETGLVPGECGDGVLNLGEECDDGDFDNTDDCTEYCLLPTCGDGYAQPSNGETCDDGNTIEGDGCNADCFQSGDTVWSVELDGADSGDDRALAVAARGGYVVVGGSQDVTGEGTNVLLWKVDADDGTDEWDRDILGPGDDSVRAVAIDSNDEIVAAGVFYVGAAPDPGGKLWRGGFASNGNEVWSDETSADGTGTAVMIDANDVAYVTGHVMGTGGPELWLERRTDGASDWITQDVYGSDSSCDLAYHQLAEGVVADDSWVYVAWRSVCPGGSFPASPRSKVSRFHPDDGTLSYNPDGCCSHWRIDVFSPGVFVGNPTHAWDMAIGPDDSTVIVGQANGARHVWGYGPGLYSTATYDAADWETSFGSGSFVDAAIDGEGNLVMASSGGRVVKTTPEGELLWEFVDATVDIEAVAVDESDYVYAAGAIETAGQGTNAWLTKLAP